MYSTPLPSRFVVGRFLLFLLLEASSYSSIGQQLPDSTALVYKPAATQQEDYYRNVISLPKLYNGPEYIDYAKLYSAANGHQFFISPDKLNGSVTYDNHVFNGVKIAYDIVLDQIVVQHANNPFTLKLLSKNVQRFTIDGHQFERLIADSSNQNVIKTGFYEALSDKTLQVYARRKKVKQEKTDQQRITLEFTSDDKLYLKKAGTFYYLNNKASLINLLKSRESEIIKYIKTNKLKFKKPTMEASILRTIQYFESLPR